MIFCPLFSGSSGNSIFIKSKETSILVDAGLSGKTIVNALSDINQSPEELKGILVTHEHGDHIKGVGILSRKYNIPIYANEKTWMAMEKSLGKLKEENIKVIHNNNLSINNLDIISYGTSHDAACPSGYAISAEGKKVCIATDLGCFSDEVKESIKDGDIILLESNHDLEMLKFGPYPYPLKRRVMSDVGHLSNEDCGKAIVSIAGYNKKNIILGHLSNTNNFPELALKTVSNILDEEGISMKEGISLNLARRDKPSCYVEI
ncbi:MAG: MBL fold metallo-hydrolase [Clostridiaceae bacterium]